MGLCVHRCIRVSLRDDHPRCLGSPQLFAITFGHARQYLLTCIPVLTMIHSGIMALVISSFAFLLFVLSVVTVTFFGVRYRGSHHLHSPLWY